MPKKLKLGVSAAWSSDASGWGAPTTSVPADNWGGWGDSLGSASGDIWDTVASEPAAADPPPDWGYDDGWDGPAPDLQAEDLFPSLSASKPASKRGRTSGSQPPRLKPADFSTVLGTRLGGAGTATKYGISSKQNERLRTRTNSQDGKSWIQNSIDKNKNRSTLDKPLSSNQPTGQSNQSQSYLKQATIQPTHSLKDILHVPKQEKSAPIDSVPQPSESIKDILNTSSSRKTEVDAGRHKMRPTQAWGLRDPSHTSVEGDRSDSLKGQSNDTKSPVQEQVVPKSNTVEKAQLDVTPVAVKRPIYNQLREQLQKVSSLGKPLVYIIQNGNITVQVAD